MCTNIYPIGVFLDDRNANRTPYLLPLSARSRTMTTWFRLVSSTDRSWDTKLFGGKEDIGSLRANFHRPFLGIKVTTFSVVTGNVNQFRIV